MNESAATEKYSAQFGMGDVAEKVRDFSALIGTLSLDPDGGLADSCWNALDHLEDGELKALIDITYERRRKSVPLAELFKPTIEGAAMNHAIGIFHDRRRARRRKAKADRSALWRERNGSLAPIVLTPGRAITPETEEEAALDARGKDALRKRKAYHDKREIDRPSLAPIATRRLINKIKGQLAALPHDELVAIDRMIEDGEVLY